MSEVKRGELYWGNGYYEIPLKRRNLNAKSAYDYDPKKGPSYAWAYLHIQTAVHSEPSFRDKGNPHMVNGLGSCHYESVYREKYRVKTPKDWAMFWDFIFTGEKPKYD